MDLPAVVISAGDCMVAAVMFAFVCVACDLASAVMETAAMFACDYAGSGSRSDVCTDLVGQYGDGKRGDACMWLHGHGNSSEVCIFRRGL